jgi:hypothetical protein
MKHFDKLERLVENAFDFLDRALWDFNKAPKHSVINFHAAIELFLKARLLAEHWSLVISRRQDADLKKFLAGDFQSVTLDEAADRLDKVVQSPLTKFELDQFKNLARHRNRLVHFFHDAATDDAAEGLKQAIAIEQLRAWYLLNRLLVDRWGEIFEKWRDRLAGVTSKLKRHRQYLQITFEQLQPEIQRKIAQGRTIEECLSCEFLAAEVTQVVGVLKNCDCLVCQLTTTYVDVSCPSCANLVRFVDEGFSQCTSCNEKFEPADLATLLDDDERGTKDYFEHGMPAHCVACDGYETVVHHGGMCVCGSCLKAYGEDEMHQCNWCGNLNAGDLEESAAIGCVACDGPTLNMDRD